MQPPNRGAVILFITMWNRSGGLRKTDAVLYGAASGSPGGNAHKHTVNSYITNLLEQNEALYACIEKYDQLLSDAGITL